MYTLRKFTWLIVLGLVLVFGVGTAFAVFLGDSGTVDVQVADNTHSVIDATTAGGAFVSYFGDNDVDFGSSGTGVFDPFVRLQADTSEQGYNTNGTLEFDTKAGKWTHAILVSHIPQRSCGPTASGLTCFELWVDINENNKTPYISLNKVEVYFTGDINLTGYSFGANATAEYSFDGNILIKDVNSGSGRADLRYDIPINDPSHAITIPPNCDYGNPACTTYFVLYSQWGTTTADAPDGSTYETDGGYEEWKVKQYPAISLTKTPSTTDVCNGSSTSVTYTYVVTNNTFGKVAVSGSVVDDNGTPGNPSDDVIVGTFSDLATGASQTFTHTFTISGTRTNIATATVTDVDGNIATATATATVTGHDCTISLTKTPNQTNVCNDSPVTYTYVVHNNSDFFTWSGKLTDDTISLPAGAASFSLSPGADATFTATANITGAVTNTATADGKFDDPATTSASATKQATVTGHVCTISLTKTPNHTEVCNGSPVTYTYVVHNNSDFYTWTGTLSDDKIGTINGTITLAPGGTQTFTATATINGTVTNTATATGTFNDPASTTASKTATVTVTGQNCSQITPTDTTCSQFASGTAATLSSLQYTVKDGMINAVSPGVFFYWIVLPASPGNNSFTIHQAITTGNFDSHFFAFAPGSNAYNSSCSAFSTTVTQSGADVTVSFDAGSGGTVYLGIKFTSSSVKDFAPPGGNGTAHYTFETLGEAGSTQGLDLSLKNP